MAAVENNVNQTPFAKMTSFHNKGTLLHQIVPINEVGDPRDIPGILEKDKNLRRLPVYFTEVHPSYLTSETNIPSDTQKKQVTDATGIFTDNE